METDSVHDVVLKNFRPNKLLDEFKFERVLKIDTKRKQVCLHCIYKDQPAILILEKNPFDEKLLAKIGNNFSNIIESGTNLFRNDIYGSYLVNLVFDQPEDDALLNRIFMSIIHPASPKDIEKYTEQPLRMISETVEMYEKITKPYIDEQCNTSGHLQWLYNILDGKAELDRIIYSDNDFIITKDMKWNCTSDDQLTELEKQSIYFNAIVKRRDLKSLRDLNADHLQLLETIYDKGCQVISSKFDIPKDQLRVFIHYQPSFYHVHIHFTHIMNDHHGFQTERAHLLSNVIENIRLMDDYYQKITLYFPLSYASKLKF